MLYENIRTYWNSTTSKFTHVTTFETKFSGRKQKWINLLMSLKKICLILIEENDNLKCTRNANHINALFLLVINMTTTIRFLQYQICQAFVKVFVAFLSALSLHSYGWGKIPKYIIERDNDFSISNIANAMPFMMK